MPSMTAVHSPTPPLACLLAVEGLLGTWELCRLLTARVLLSTPYKQTLPSQSLGQTFRGGILLPTPQLLGSSLGSPPGPALSAPAQPPSQAWLAAWFAASHAQLVHMHPALLANVSEQHLHYEFRRSPEANVSEQHLHYGFRRSPEAHVSEQHLHYGFRRSPEGLRASPEGLKSASRGPLSRLKSVARRAHG